MTSHKMFDHFKHENMNSVNIQEESPSSNETCLTVSSGSTARSYGRLMIIYSRLHVCIGVLHHVMAHGLYLHTLLVMVQLFR